MGKKTVITSTPAPYERNPLEPQVPYLEQGLGRAEDLYGYMTGTPPDQYAGAIQAGADVDQQLLSRPRLADLYYRFPKEVTDGKENRNHVDSDAV